MLNSFMLIKLRSLANHKNSAESRLIEYISEHPHETVDLTINALAERSDVSYATVCRLMSRLGFLGYKEFKKTLREELSDEVDAIDRLNTEIDLSQSVGGVMDSVCKLAVSVVKNCRGSVSASELAAVSECLENAGFVYFVGLGTAAVTAHYACTKLFRLAIPCAYDSDIIIAKMKTSLLKRGDVLFALSSSGRTKGIIELARLAKENGITVISLSDYIASPLSKYSDISLCTTACDSGRYADEDFPLIQGQITIVDMVYNCCFSAISDSSSNFERTKRAVRDEKRQQ